MGEIISERRRHVFLRVVRKSEVKHEKYLFGSLIFKPGVLSGELREGTRLVPAYSCTKSALSHSTSQLNLGRFQTSALISYIFEVCFLLALQYL